MAAPTTWIRDDDALRGLVDRGVDSAIAVDLEADSYHHYHERICLLQMSVDHRHYLVDPLAAVRLAVLEPWLGDPTVRKIFHGADYDLRLLHRDHGLRVRGLFDTMVAARLTGERSFGLASLLEKHFDVRLDKSLQRADWSVRPLPADMETYAVEDTRHLERLSDRLERSLRELGRADWAEEEFRRLEGVRWAPPDDGAAAYLRVKRARSLDAAGLAVLRALHAWRDARARARDRPPSRILRDVVMVAIAREKPSSLEALRRVPEVPRAFVRGESAAEEILDAVARGRQAPPEDDVPEERPSRSPGVDEARLRRFKKARDRVAVALGLEASLVCSRRVLEGIAERVELGEAWESHPDLRQWQSGLLAPCVAEVWGGRPGL